MHDDTKALEIDKAWEDHRIEYDTTRGHIDRNTKRRQWLLSRIASQNGLCVYCGDVMSLPEYSNCREDVTPDPLRATKDHVIPTDMGGEDEYENIVAACYTCNNMKGQIPPSIWLGWIINATKYHKDPQRLREYLRLEARAYQINHSLP